MWSDNTFFNGPFEPWHQEANTYDLQVVGEIPRELNGALYRGSANQHLRPVHPERHHWFDGDGMTFGVFLRDGKAHSANRWVKTASFKAEAEKGEQVYGSFLNGGLAPDPSVEPAMRNVANTNVMLFDDRLLVFQETDLPHELHPTTLETQGQYDFHGSVTGAVTAHWKIDPRNGDLLFYGLNGQTVTYYHANSHGKLLDSHAFDMGHVGVMHDFVATDDYAVFHIAPMLPDIANMLEGKPSWVYNVEAASPTRFAVLNRHTGAVTWFGLDDDCVATHFFNGYQDGDRIVVDGTRSGRWGWLPEEAQAAEQYADKNFWFKQIEALPWRWELDMRTGTVTERQTNDLSGDFPRINDEYMVREHRYGYWTTIQSTDYSAPNGLAKYDYHTDQTKHISAGELTSPSEPVFVPRESATAEDDGWILALWWNPVTRLTELLIHDAQQFDAEPVARVQLMQRVPPGFHGNWVGGEAIEAALSSQAQSR